ncbi:MAG: UDP-glucose 6-dehydrogenase [Alphaproteobacteria bacterium MarineAlpha9_Bin3]|nr:MAG: UDP-glucose 6-dehydrogenase [Alphaproteobacteria bacterium MarineAlpha9_Bin3]|tara:strand:- start:3180 stop:4514 length:1335 start_codon:yes stop_codon:yes gene_type:complete
MNISIIGTGYVGLVSGACFSEFGFNVTCIDKDKNKINNLNNGLIPIYEPSLEDLVKKNVKAKRLSFSTNLAEDFENSDAIFIAVGTPTNIKNNKADLKYIYEVAKEIAELINIDADPKLIVTKSTVPVGTGKNIESYMLNYRKELKINLNFEVASNPEFLREGSAIEDFMRPDRVICGVESNFAKSILEKLYRPLNLRETPILFSKRETAELIKYAANGFLATKITFINEMADICERVGADIQEVAKGIGLDGRIGSKFLHPGPGFGGSCFPKDTRALSEIGKEVGAKSAIIDSVIKVNEARKVNMVKKIKDALGPLKNKSLSILGITFKPNTDDMRESPSLVIIPELIKITKEVKVYDPAGMSIAKEMKEFEGVTWMNDTYECINNTDAIVLITEWNEFRALDLYKVKTLLNKPVIIDLRNIYKPDSMSELGFQYVSIGRGSI